MMTEVEMGGGMCEPRNAQWVQQCQMLGERRGRLSPGAFGEHGPADTLIGVPGLWK